MIQKETTLLIYHQRRVTSGNVMAPILVIIVMMMRIMVATSKFVDCIYHYYTQHIFISYAINFFYMTGKEFLIAVSYRRG